VVACGGKNRDGWLTKHERFERDEKKAKENLRKHRISFQDAEATLSDEFYEINHVEYYDEEHRSDFAANRVDHATGCDWTINASHQRASGDQARTRSL
jgi:uncharacterized DUF497 family protein